MAALDRNPHHGREVEGTVLIRAAAPFTSSERPETVGIVPAHVMDEMVRVVRRSAQSVRVEQLAARF